MKVVTIVRTLNEQRNIERFCKQYDFSDKILISDGGSTDKTKQIAHQFPNVEIRDFLDRIPLPGNTALTFTHEPRQINDSISWAKTYNPDWIIYDDCDCWPNKDLKQAARKVLEVTPAAKVFAYRLYLYKKSFYFPDMNDPGQILWAWRPKDCAVYANEEDPTEQNLVIDPHPVEEKLSYPYVLLHNFAQDNTHIAKKMQWYAWKNKPQQNPLQSCGRLERRPEWAVI